ncbi:cytochrome c biogenesis protein CcdA [Actinotalea sp. M2MS4P-6]|uniref:cytochrome c biogenesis CcdA family protein n=1 Tax=Actinotalea sp. M2MS4P-6 TaxID=2983762 RepID=UPI0021E4BA5A|nr:cytochrome c biogenesis protein CcdA [Actinotalea sp. M2MS4P-6]MCV2394873.1 cytochrome c biogenesis protein CcdA [Actinotalea sp. M2MS4P-6]
MLLAVPLAVVAGLVSFASPCVLPLVPGYLGFVSGMAASGAAAPARNGTSGADGSGAGGAGGGTGRTGGTLTEVRRSRLLLGVALFVAGFTVVFVVLGVLAGSVGQALLRYADTITMVLGVVVIVMGLVFAGWLPIAQRERRLHVAPTAGLWGAPLLGLVFGLGWVPCIGPTLVAVYTLALDQASGGRGAVLSVAYCVGLGLPFLLVALGLERSQRVLGVLRTHRVAVMRIGGGLLVLIGIALVTGLWGMVTESLQSLIGGFEPVV